MCVAGLLGDPKIRSSPRRTKLRRASYVSRICQKPHCGRRVTCDASDEECLYRRACRDVGRRWEPRRPLPSMLLLVNVSFGLCIAIGLYFIGVPNAALWGRENRGQASFLDSESIPKETAGPPHPARLLPVKICCLTPIFPTRAQAPAWARTCLRSSSFFCDQATPDFPRRTCATGNSGPRVVEPQRA